MTPRHASLEELHLPASVLTIGSFDGVHRGHQALIGAMVEDARRLGHPAIVLTFFPHPSVVLRGRRPSFYIMTPEEKAALASGDLRRIEAWVGKLCGRANARTLPLRVTKQKTPKRGFFCP